MKSIKKKVGKVGELGKVGKVDNKGNFFLIQYGPKCSKMVKLVQNSQKASKGL